MTVLLIDGVGRAREYEIRHWMPVIYVAIPQPVSVRMDETPALSAYCALVTARFEYSDELSIPPIYRFVFPV